MALPNLSDAAIQQTDALQSQFGGFTNGVASSCDLMGTIGAIKDKVTQYVVDEVTGIVTEVQVAISEVVADIKDGLSGAFGGSGSVLNSVKGYITEAQEIAADIAAKASQISEAIMIQLNSLMDSISTGIQFVVGAVQDAIGAVMAGLAVVQDKLADTVANIKMGLCSTLSSVLAGSPDDAFANITTGATDLATQSLGAVKDVYNTGASDTLAVTGALAETAGVSPAVTGLQDAAKGAQNVAGGAVGTTMTDMGQSITSMRTILAGIA